MGRAREAKMEVKSMLREVWRKEGEEEGSGLKEREL